MFYLTLGQSNAYLNAKWSQKISSGPMSQSSKALPSPNTDRSHAALEWLPPALFLTSSDVNYAIKIKLYIMANKQVGQPYQLPGCMMPT